MDAKLQYLTYAAIGKPRMFVAGIPLRETMSAASAKAARPALATQMLQRIELLTVQIGAWIRTRTAKPAQLLREPHPDLGNVVKFRPGQRLVSWAAILTAGGFLVVSIGWWSGEWYQDYQQSVAEKKAVEQLQSATAQDQSNQAGDAQDASLTAQEVLPLGLANDSGVLAISNEVIHVVDEPAMLQPSPNNQPAVKVSDRVMPAPLPGRDQAIRVTPSKSQELEIESPRKTNAQAIKSQQEEPPPRAVILDASKPPQQPEAKAETVQVKAPPPADTSVPKSSTPAKPDVAVQVKSQVTSVPVQTGPKPASAPQPATPAPASGVPKKQFAEPIDVTESTRTDKPATPSPGPTKTAVTVVDIAQDGSYALITNPATRLPQRYAVGEKIFTGEVLKSIDPGKGRLQLDKRSVDME